MKEAPTNSGKTYSVHTAKGCTVSDDSGWSKAIEAPDGYFTAHGSSVQLSDDEATLREVFKLAPYQKLRLLGVVGGDTLAWLKALREELTAMLDGSAFELAWLAGTKQLIVHTDRVDDAMLAAVKATAEAAAPAGAEVVQYNHNMEISWRDVNKYAECTCVADMTAVNPDYLNDLTSENAWEYNLPGMVDVRENVFNGSPMKIFRGSLPNLKIAGIGYGKGFFQGINIISFECELPALEQESYSFIASRNMMEWNIELPKLRSAFQMFRYTSMTEWHVELPNLRASHCMFGNSKMVDFKVELPSLTDGIYMFESCQLNRESALRVLNSIPAYTSGNHPMHIGIHVDHQYDEEVLEARANAEAKGWTITVQWNGKPTVQTVATYGLRKPPIYARVGEMEGPDGTVERILDWGHYVTDPTGYETFRSVEAAREYFGIPEETLTETE